MKVSILTPCYNASPFLEKIWKCLINEGIQGLEWIVVDDGSSDDSLKVLHALLKRKRLNMMVIEQSNRGACAARNSALEKSTGHWIKFLDADDYFKKGHLVDLLEASSNQKADAFIAPTLHIKDNTKESVLRVSRWESFPEDLLQFKLKGGVFTHSAGLFRRENVDKIGGWDESLLADQDGNFLFRLLVSGATFISVPDAKPFCYRIHKSTSRISGTDSEEKIKSRLQVAHEMLSYVKENDNFDERYLEAVAQRFYRIACRAALVDKKLSRFILDQASEISSKYDCGDNWKRKCLRSVLGFEVSIRLLRFLGK